MKKQIIAMGAILFATLLWGMTFSFIKSAVATLSPYNFLFWRFGSAALILTVFFFPKIKKGAKVSLLPGFLLGIFLLGTVLFQTMGLQTVPASVASFITGLSVILVPLISSGINKKMPTPKVFLASLMAIIGIGLISFTKTISFSGGELWVLICAVFFAIYILLAGKYSKTHTPIPLTAIQCVTIFFLSGVIAFFTGTFAVPTSSTEWISIIFCAIFASICAFLLQLYFQRYLTSSTTAIIFSCEPIFATIAAMILLDERPNEFFYWGAGLIFTSILISELSLKKKQVPQD